MEYLQGNGSNCGDLAIHSSGSNNRRRLLPYCWASPPRIVAVWAATLLWLCATVSGSVLPVSDIRYHGNQLTSEVVFVNTSDGPVAGMRRAMPGVGGGSVIEFLSIPYAEPPVGSRRFQPPEARAPWQDIPNANGSRPNACPQPIDTAFGDFIGSRRWSANTPMSEDCLYLNVWTPRVIASTAASDGTSRGDGLPVPGLPVMVWIHGGTFLTGSASRDVHDGKALAAAGNVVVVSMNYRLGMLGFLAVPAPPPKGGLPRPQSQWPLPGNLGLLDQVLALRWVQRNAQFFGGDPGAVTLFGSSAGASSVAFHLMRPPQSSQPLFHRAIVQSGTALSGWAHMTAESAEQRLRLAASDTSCWDLYADAYETPSAGGGAGNHSYHEAVPHALGRLLECLRNLPLDSILRAQGHVTSTGQNGLLHAPFLPVLLPNDPPSLPIAGGKEVPLLIGVDADESSALVVYLPDLAPSFNSSDVSPPVDRAMLVRVLTASFRSYPQWPFDATSSDVDLIACHYASSGGSDRDESRANLRALMAAVSDALLVCPVGDLAVDHASTAVDGSRPAATFYYTFAHVSSSKAWGRWTGAMHGDELDYVFGDPLRAPQQYSPDERRLSENVINLWTNFARTGNPTTGRLQVSFMWPSFSNNSRLSYEISLESLREPKFGTVQYDKCRFLDECLSVSPRRNDTNETRILPDICSCPVNKHNDATKHSRAPSLLISIVTLGMVYRG